ncbi:helix-turn-helix domain-containing protein [Knoellia sp. CPCC 206453]|uniref:helix-turn-helix domain-containing protein n=1 Tax=Knoellia pratensis TaxID=3404796 RepID=UPI00361DABBE
MTGPQRQRATGGRHPGEQRYAMIAPYASQWLKLQLAEGRQVTRATARQHALWLRSQGEAMFATQVEGALLQLDLSAADHQAAFDRTRARRPPTTTISAVGNGQAETATVERESAQDNELPTQEVAKMLGLTPRRVGQMVSDGTLSGRKVGGAWLVSRSSVEALADTRRAS